MSWLFELLQCKNINSAQGIQIALTQTNASEATVYLPVKLISVVLMHSVTHMDIVQFAPAHQAMKETHTLSAPEVSLT